MLRQDWTKTGSVLVWTVLVIAMLSLIAVETLRLVTAKYQNALQTSTWQEALLAAESGIDLAIVELRKSLYPQPNYAWEGWNNPPGNEVTGYELTTVPNAGLNGTPMTIETNVDAPSRAQLAPDPVSQQALRFLRSSGEVVELNGDIVLATEQFEKMRNSVIDFLRKNNSAATSELRQLLGTSRRVIIPFLERLDRDGVTRRIADKRVLARAGT